MTYRSHRGLLTLMLAAVSAFSLVACQQAVLDADVGKVVVRRVIDENPRTIDPHKSGDVVSSRMIGHVYETLFEYDLYANPPKLNPCLAAQDAEVNADSTEFIVTIRDDVLFQDNPCFPGGKGRRMSIEDVLYSFKRIASLADSGGYWVLQGKVKGLDAWRELVISAGQGLATDEEIAQAKQAEFDRPVEGLSILDNRRIRFSMQVPYPQFLYAITLSYGAVVPREAVEMYGDRFFYNPVGTGPFVLKRWDHNLQLVFERNPNYREVLFAKPPADLRTGNDLLTYDAYQALAGKRLPLADAVIWRIIKEPQAAWLEFQSGSLDRTLEVTKDHFTVAFQNDDASPEMREKNIHALKVTAPQIQYLSFSMNDPIVGVPAGEKGRAIRQAFNLAFNRQYYLNTYRNGRGEIATQMLPPMTVGYDPSYLYPWSRYAPDEGRKILEDAGFRVTKVGDEWQTFDPATGKRVGLSINVRGTSTDDRDRASFLVSVGHDIGIEVAATTLTFPEFLERSDKKIGQAFEAGWVMDYPDAQNMLQLLYGKNAGISGINTADYVSAEFDQAYEEMEKLDETKPDQLARKLELIRIMHKVLERDCPWIMILFDKDYNLYHDWFRFPPACAFNYTDAKYYSSDSHRRAQRAHAWRENNTTIGPALVLLLIAGSLVTLFIIKVVMSR